MHHCSLFLLVLLSIAFVDGRGRSHRHANDFDSFESTTRSEDSLEEPEISIQDSELNVAREGKIRHKMGASFRGRAKNEQNIIERSSKSSGAEVDDEDERAIPLQAPSLPTQMHILFYWELQPTKCVAPDIPSCTVRNLVSVPGKMPTWICLGWTQLAMPQHCSIQSGHIEYEKKRCGYSF